METAITTLEEEKTSLEKEVVQQINQQRLNFIICVLYTSFYRCLI